MGCFGCFFRFFRSGESTNLCGFRYGFFTGDPIAGLGGSEDTGAAEDRFSPGLA